MFAYCGNNPVNRKDSAGTIWTAAITVGLGTIANVAVKAVAAKITGEAFTVQDAIGAAVEGAIATTLTVLGGSAVLANTFGAICGSMTTVILKEDYTEDGIKGIIENTLSTCISTAALGGAGKLLQKYWGGKYVDADYMSDIVKKVFYKPKYVNENSIKTIVSDTILDSLKNFPLEFI